ncbi:MAG TPA: right-handed parallel beta-helix repeat-containing protein [Polyangia bacterium]|nr:right-handed parallel beta-helix repeat-containing protein [Polyangia bacterium]
MIRSRPLLSALLFTCSVPSVVYAGSLTVGPGETVWLTADVILGNGDSVDAVGTADNRCTIFGGGFQIKTAPDTQLETGHVNIRYCTLTEVGDAGKPAIDVQFGADTDFTMSDSTVDASGMIHIFSTDRATVLFRRNLLKDTSRVSVIKELIDLSEPAFLAEGFSPAQKVFQGNRVLRSWAEWSNVANWTIGTSAESPNPAEGNVFIGVRGGAIVWASHDIEFRGNYLRAIEPKLGWNQVATFSATDGPNIIVEHNVFRGGNWIVREFGGGELRYNLIGDGHTVSWVIARTASQARIHHNVFFHTEKLMAPMTDERVDGVEIIDVGVPSVEVYNNTFDGSNCYDPLGSGVAIQGGSVLKSLRSNAFFAIATDLGPATATVGLGRDENGMQVQKMTPAPARLGYADYNLFDNRQGRLIDNYAVAVAGKAERRDPGFALNDVPAGGGVDAQADPKLTGPLPRAFPFSDQAIIDGTVNVCQILAFYRTFYTPGAGSPLIDKGDPADGMGVDIGAIDAGMAHPADQFGKLCRPEDSALPAMPALVTVCPTPIRLDTSGSVGGNSGGDGGVGPPGVTPDRELRCVCAIDAAGPTPGEASVLFLAIFGVLRLRRRRGHA